MCTLECVPRIGKCTRGAPKSHNAMPQAARGCHACLPASPLLATIPHLAPLPAPAHTHARAQSPELPADVFTACLTTPIKVALRWFCSRSLLRHDGINKDLIDQIPGRQVGVRRACGCKGGGPPGTAGKPPGTARL